MSNPKPVKVVLIHTVVGVVQTFQALCTELLPQQSSVEVFNIVDDSLLADTIKEGHLKPVTYRRLGQYVVGAEESGADVVMVTCSSMGPCVEASRLLVNIPVLRVDEAMAEEAIRVGMKIGVMATLSTTLEPTCQLIRKSQHKQTDKTQKEIEIVSKLVDGAFAALKKGDTPLHDSMVLKGLQELLSEGVDVIVLAQASMARVLSSLDEQLRNKVPILSSPRLGIERLKETVAAIQQQQQ